MSHQLRVPACLADRLWQGDGQSQRQIYAWTLALQRERRVLTRLAMQGLYDTGSEAFGAALWEEGERLACRRCGREILRWHPRRWWCSARCRDLWLASHPLDTVAALAIAGAVTAASRLARR